MAPGALHVNLFSRWIQRGLLLASGPSFSLLVYSLVYQVKIVSHVYSFGKLRVSEPFCFTVSHFGGYFVPMCEVTEIAVVTSVSFVMGIDMFMHGLPTEYCCLFSHHMHCLCGPSSH